jgi:hypothetical protein
MAGPDLDWLTPQLAIGGHFGEGHVERLALDHGVSAVVDLRAECCDDEIVLRRHGITFLHLPTCDLAAISPPMLRDGVAFVGGVLDAGQRALVHCQHGIGRSALLSLCVLVDRGLAPLDALALAKSRRPRVSPSPAQLSAWAEWLGEHRRATGAGWDVPSFEACAAIAYRPPER